MDLLEDEIIGPLYKIVLLRPESGNIIEGMNRFIAGPGPYSVSKINQMISLFVTVLDNRDKKIRQRIAFKRESRIEPQERSKH